MRKHMLFFATLESGKRQIEFDRNLMIFRKNLVFKLIYGKTPQLASMKFSKQLEGYQGNSGNSSDLKFNHSLKY
jgi:hypothetical protein